MGIKGLTSTLKNCGPLPSLSDDTGEMFCFLPKHMIEAGSTLAIDGPGFAFHIFRLAYFQHYQRVLELNQKNTNVNNDNKNSLDCESIT